MYLEIAVILVFTAGLGRTDFENRTGFILIYYIWFCSLYLETQSSKQVNIYCTVIFLILYIT